MANESKKRAPRTKEYVDPDYIVRLTDKIGAQEVAERLGVSDSLVRGIVTKKTPCGVPYELASELIYSNKFGGARRIVGLLTAPEEHFQSLTKIAESLGGKVQVIDIK